MTGKPDMKDPDTPLGAVWKYLGAHWEEGVDCPACEQNVQVKWQNINPAMAISMTKLYKFWRQDPDRWVHIPTEIGRISAEEAKLVHWGLLEERPGRRADSGRAGFWRITPLGVAWVHDGLRVPRYVLTYNGKDVGGGPRPNSRTGRVVRWDSIQDALGNKFNLRLLLEGEA